MNKGQRVSFSWGEPSHVHYGTVICDEVDGHVLVAQDPDPPEVRHSVIWCTVTWLTPVDT
jgi:hypothetical protein